MRTVSAAMLLALLLGGVAYAPAQAQNDSGLVNYESQHYRLGTDTPAETAREYLKVLEAAWPQYEAFLGKSPALKNDERLNIYFLETQDGWLSKLKADHVEIPVGAGGYYWPGNRNVYLWRQPTLYTSRQLLIHEAMHQFHYIACCNNVGPKDVWYIEGVVEYLSRHFWDGQTLTLGVVPMCSLEDYPRLALDLFERDDFDLAAMIDGQRACTRPEQWALVRYLCLAEEGKLKPAWQNLAARLNAGETGKAAFRQALGEPAKLQPKIKEWLKTQQEPMVPVWNEWWGLAPGAVAGTAKVTSGCRARQDASSFSATLHLPAQGPWKGGLLIGFEDSATYAVALFDNAGGISVNLRKDEKWQVLRRGKTAPAKTEGQLQLRAERTPAGIRLVQDEVEVGVFDLPGKKMGLCLENCTLTFTDIVWK
ncbi:MAG: hypothetical protein IPP14_06520 [Planctomycetes bacterium]|nr:hypothetical protein [Planctomycetota bacterium]